MTCENQINTEDLINAKSDAITMGEVATSRAGGEPSGTPITQSTNRFGQTTDTLQGRLNKIGVIIGDPIPDWSPLTQITQLEARRYPASTGDIYIPTKPLPFTTGTLFNVDDWVLYNGYTEPTNTPTDNFELLNDAITSTDTKRLYAGALLQIKDRASALFDVVLTSTVAPDTYGIIECTGIPTLSLKIRANYNMTAEAFGASTSLPDNSGAINAALKSKATVISSNDELLIQATVLIPSGKQCDGLKVYVDGDVFTTAYMPVCLVVNENFGTFASNPNSDIWFVNGSIRITNNTATVNPKLIMFGGVANGHIKNNKLTAEGAKHSAAIECYKSTKDIWIEDNKISITTGDVTGGGIWLANRTTNEVSENIYVNNNVIEQDSVDEIIALFPVAGPMQKIRFNDNLLTRLNSGATDGVGFRVFCADGLGGGAPTATLTDVKGNNNTIIQNRTTNISSGTMQIGNATIDNNDPTDISFTNTTVRGYFPSTSIAMRFDLNAKAVDVRAESSVVINEGAFDASNQGIVDSVGGVKIIGGSADNFGTGVTGYDVEGVEVKGGSIGVKAFDRAVNNMCLDQESVPMRVVAKGAGVSQLIKGNKLKSTATKRCLQLDATDDVIENLRLFNNDFDGSAGSVTAITKLGLNNISYTQTENNDFSTCATLWTNTLGMTLGRNTYNPAITNPVGNISADPSSEFWNPAGGAGSTLYVKEANTGDTGWVAK
jgi:hypothetical protein